jgi:hypothetical protein
MEEREAWSAMPLRGTGPVDRCRNETSAGYVSQKTPMLFSAPSYGGSEDGTLCVLVNET